MAIINAAANGLWSSAATWPGGVFPTAADDVFANNRTIYIDQNIDVLSLNTTAGAGGVAGGRFYVNQGNFTINAANIIQAGSTFCVTVTGTGTRTLSSNFFRASDTTNTTAAVLIQGTATALPNVITYGNAVGGTAAGVGATSHPAGITVDGGMLTHYGFISGGNVISRSSGLKLYQTATNTVPITAIIYSNVKGGPQSTCTGIISEISPATTTLSACLVNIYGNLSGGDSLLNATTNNSGLYHNSSLTINISGDLVGGAGNSYNNGGVIVVGAGTINVVGNIYTHPNFGFSPGFFGGSGSTTLVNITGNVFALDPFAAGVDTNGFGAPGFYIDGSITANIYGNIYGAMGSRNFGGVGAYISGQNSVTNIFGNVYGGSAGKAYGIYTFTRSGIRVNVVGNVYGSAVDSAIDGHGIVNVIASTVINISGSAIAGEGAGNYGVFNTAAATVYAKRAVANSYGIGSAQVAYNQGYGLFAQSISSINLVEEMVFGKRGQIPVFGPTYIVNTTTNSITGRKQSLTSMVQDQSIDVFVDSTVTNTLVPSVSNVVLGTAYNNDTLTGTMVVPSITSVSFDIPVGSTRGTAYLTPSAFWNTQTTELTSLSTVIGYRLNNTATTEFIGNTLAAYNI